MYQLKNKKMKPNIKPTTKTTAKKGMTETNKKTFLKLFKENYSNISVTCDLLKINRSTYYGWVKKDEWFKEECQNIIEGSIDFAETQLKKMIEGFEYEEVETIYIPDAKSGEPKIKELRKKKVRVLPNVTAVIFHLKTQGKHRGYVERVENDVTINPFLELMKQATEEDS